MSQVKACPHCHSTEISEVTANKYYAWTAVFAVIGIVLLFVNYIAAILGLCAMIGAVIGAVSHPNPSYRCKSCGQEYKLQEA